MCAQAIESHKAWKTYLHKLEILRAAVEGSNWKSCSVVLARLNEGVAISDGNCFALRLFN